MPAQFTRTAAAAVAVLATCLGWFATSSPVLGQAQPATEMRTWTDSQGRTMQASLAGIEGDHALFLMSGGQPIKFPLNKLSPADQEFIKKNKAATPAPAPTGGGPAVPVGVPTRLPIEKRTWPKEVEVPARSIEIAVIVEKPEEKNCVYQSEAFSFHAEEKLAGSVMKEIARTFEATRTLLQTLPWAIDPKPPVDVGRFQAKFYATRQSYIANGGPENSGGVYMSRDRTFRIPFQSLGLKQVGKTWAKDDGYSNDTIIHEITHQLMHDYLAFLPTWVIEGTAEYTEMLPYKAGRFRASAHQSGFKEYLQQAEQRGVTLADINVAGHLMMKGADWNAQSSSGGIAQFRLYFASCVMVYYFCHVDGDGNGTRFLKYLDKIAEAREAWNVFFANPLVKVDKETGRYSWDPSKVTPPAFKQDEEYGFEQLQILMDGRTPQQLETEMKAGFKKIGVKW
jgi:hypothetical protein